MKTLMAFFVNLFATNSGSLMATASNVEARGAVADARLENGSEFYSSSEVKNLIRNFSIEVWLEIESYAKDEARRSGYEFSAEWLIIEAVTRSVREAKKRERGVRRWRRGYDAKHFFCGKRGILRSIADAERKRFGREFSEYDDECEYDQQNPGHAGPFENLQNKDEVRRVLSLFDDDPIARRVIISLIDGLTREQIQTRYALSSTAYESKRRKIIRRTEANRDGKL